MVGAVDELLSSVVRYRYSFRPKNLPVLTREVAGRILEYVSRGITELYVTLDLGLSKEVVRYVNDSRCIDIRGSCIDVVELGKLKEGFIYVVKGSTSLPVAWYDHKLRRYYKLKPVGFDKAPTLEINGIHMHRCEGIDPWSDSVIKVRQLGKLRGAVVLDTCTGLGYTASIAMQHGAYLIVTSEIDPNVIEVATYNPWSRGLAGRNIVTLMVDVTKLLHELPDEVFTHVLHDPPRFSVCGELYSREVYAELYRILKKGGRLFHYTGTPFKHSNVSLLKGIKRRLELVGFHVIKWDEEAQGFVAVKRSA